MLRTSTPSSPTSYVPPTPSMKRLGNVAEQARVALFLASNESSFITGEEIFVDGGMTRFHP